MGDYKVAIKIAGQLEGSFNRTLKMAQSGIGGLAKIGKIGATAMAASAAAMGTLAAAGIKAGVEYEQAFAGVRKTVDATEAELQALSQGIRDMAKEMPTSASEIARGSRSGRTAWYPDGEYPRIYQDHGHARRCHEHECRRSSHITGKAGEHHRNATKQL